MFIIVSCSYEYWTWTCEIICQNLDLINILWSLFLGLFSILIRIISDNVKHCGASAKKYVICFYLELCIFFPFCFADFLFIFLYYYRYIYHPLLGKPYNVYKKVYALGFSFLFVSLWHKIDKAVCTWTFLNFLLVLSEIAAVSFFSSRKVKV